MYVLRYHEIYRVADCYDTALKLRKLIAETQHTKEEYITMHFAGELYTKENF